MDSEVTTSENSTDDGVLTEEDKVLVQFVLKGKQNGLLLNI